MLTAILLIRLANAMYTKGMVIVNTPHKRLKRPSSFDLEPIYMTNWNMQFTKWHVRKWLRVYQRGYTHIPVRKVRWYTYGVDAHYAWTRVFRRGYVPGLW
jgi:hypothetical protein